MRAKLAMALLSVALAGCRVVPQADTPPGAQIPPLAPATSALAAGVRPGPAFASLPVGRADAAAALASFRESCPRLLAREDRCRRLYRQLHIVLFRLRYLYRDQGRGLLLFGLCTATGEKNEDDEKGCRQPVWMIHCPFATSRSSLALK